MALNSLYCADVPLSNYSLTHTIRRCQMRSFFTRLGNGLHAVTPFVTRHSFCWERARQSVYDLRCTVSTRTARPRSQ